LGQRAATAGVPAGAARRRGLVTERSIAANSTGSHRPGAILRTAPTVASRGPRSI